MTIADLRKALADLPPEYDGSMVIVSVSGMSGPAEATRLITIPTLTNLDRRPSYEEFDRVVWLCDGGTMVSKQAESEGWKVPYYNPNPTPATRTLVKA